MVLTLKVTKEPEFLIYKNDKLLRNQRGKLVSFKSRENAVLFINSRKDNDDYTIFESLPVGV